MEERQYIKIAYWYYLLGLTQDEIAKRLSFTRQKVNAIIKTLPKNGFVSISIHGYERDYVELECWLETRFGLNRAIVATDYSEDEDIPEAETAKVTNVAAQYLDETIQQGDIIGISWGRTLSRVVEQMNYKKKDKCLVLQMMGAQNICHNAEKSDEIARSLANRLDCPSRILYAPVIVENSMTKEFLMREQTVRASFESMRKCSIAILGVGELTRDATISSMGIISGEMIDQLRSEGFVADISMNPIRGDGSWDSCPLADRIVNADMDCLKNIENAILIACGVHKTEAIRAALLSGCANTFITGGRTARQIRSMDGDGDPNPGG
jgi:DNA-binding transcriptional regulator LsrR (DeoR family)